MKKENRGAHRTFLILLLIMVMLLCFWNTQAVDAEESQTEEAEQVIPQTVTIENPDDAGNGVVQVNLSYIDEKNEPHIICGGSGFLIGDREQSSSQYVITCNHILNPDEELRNEAFLFYEVSKEKEKWDEIVLQIQVVMENDVVTNATVVKASKELDLTVLLLNEPIHTRVPLSILTSDDGSPTNLPYAVTDKIYALGFPESIRYDSDMMYYANKQVTMSTGSIVNMTQIDGIQMIQHDAEIGENNCGGPLVDDAGRVIGMNLTRRDGNYYCAVDSTAIVKVLDAIGLTYDKITTEQLRALREQEPEPEVITETVIPAWIFYIVIVLLAVILVLVILLIVTLIRGRRRADPDAVNARKKAKEEAKKEKAKSRVKQPDLPEAIKGQDGNKQAQTTADGMDTSVLNPVGGGGTTMLGAAGTPGAANYSGTLIRHKTGENILLNKRIITLGKDSLHVDYYIKDNSAISRKHAQIRQEADGVYVEDCHSTNGTFVNNRRVSEDHPQMLTNGDVIRLGNEEFDYRL